MAKQQRHETAHRMAPHAGPPIARGSSLGFALILALAGCEEHGHGHEHAETPAVGSPAQNPVQTEMRLLSTALEGTVRGIGQGDVRAVEHDLHRVHAAREATEAALHDGSYRPPSAADQLERFVELDEAFHHDLEGLVEASRANDVPATAQALGRVMSQCQGCHEVFRAN